MNHVISPKEAVLLLENPEAVFIDVRTPREYKEGHIPNSINIDFYNPLFVEEIKKFDTHKTYIMNCQSGGRSGRATEVMLELGFKDPRNLLGGFLSWKAQKLPVAK